MINVFETTSKNNAQILNLRVSQTGLKWRFSQYTHVTSLSSRDADTIRRFIAIKNDVYLTIKVYFQNFHFCFRSIRFFIQATFFSTQLQCCLTFSSTELQMLFRCCLIHMTINILRHILYLVYFVQV